MIECPICGIYWDYLNRFEPGYHPEMKKYEIMEQTDCIQHVAREHSTLILSECLENEIINLKEMIEKIRTR